MFDNFVWSQISQNAPLGMCFWYKRSVEIAHLASRCQSLQTWFKTKKLIDIPPPAVGGWQSDPFHEFDHDLAHKCQIEHAMVAGEAPFFERTNTPKGWENLHAEALEVVGRLYMLILCIHARSSSILAKAIRHLCMCAKLARPHPSV